MTGLYTRYMQVYIKLSIKDISRFIKIFTKIKIALNFKMATTKTGQYPLQLLFLSFGVYNLAKNTASENHDNYHYISHFNNTVILCYQETLNKI